MAHIASCTYPGVDLNHLNISSYIVPPLSPLPRTTESGQQASKPWVWRMAQPDSRKYQLFPRGNQNSASPVKVLAPEQAYAVAMGQNTEKTDKCNAGTLRFRVKEHNLPVPARRRKVSVPELGPMTTVHESSMDSPTIPGRPILHERSASAPGNAWKLPTYSSKSSTNDTESKASTSTRPPLSPKDLPPLMIPAQMSSASPLKRQLSLGRLRSGSSNNDHARSARPEDSPKSKGMYTPLSATTPGSASTAYSSMTTSTLPTPVSAIPEEHRGSPRPFKLENLSSNPGTPTESSASTFTNDSRSGSSTASHRRNVSESSSITGSIMDRGRPKKRNEGPKTTEAKKSRSSERRAFETLPKGWKVPDAVKMLTPSETNALHKQGLAQAERFEILRKCDVDRLSRELRNLDERCDYLRRTYHSLRAGRRNLHSRICSYLRSPRMVKFSQESLLKQEEALAELDNSIDDWVNKLEQAENRRTRVRQKLLEHVAAAVTLPVPGDDSAMNELQFALSMKSPTAPACPSTPPRSPTKESLNTKTGVNSPSPQRVVAQVPSTIINQPIPEEEPASVGLGIAQAANETLTAGIRRAEVESIRIYAGDEVAALLADVEQEITRMSKAGERNAALREKDAASLRVIKEAVSSNEDAILSEKERRELHRARSAEALQAGLKNQPSSASLNGISTRSTTPTSSNSSISSSATTPTVTEEKQEDLSNFMLTPAVFNPQAAAVH
ncbi:hypothetical protein N0V82_006872 [Gnomoniopsis sp. IMI 355080]|nr:hypothetical protein N0V82_006872 [Gnomoniopsis sp. IMI 355080]